MTSEPVWTRFRVGGAFGLALSLVLWVPAAVAQTDESAGLRFRPEVGLMGAAIVLPEDTPRASGGAGLEARLTWGVAPGVRLGLRLGLLAGPVPYTRTTLVGENGCNSTAWTPWGVASGNANCPQPASRPSKTAAQLFPSALFLADFAVSEIVSLDVSAGLGSSIGAGSVSSVDLLLFRVGAGASFRVFKEDAIEVRVRLAFDVQLLDWLLPQAGLSVAF